jgi:cytosine/adenosine deaminase-related metal-dependent hydrolase
MDLTIRNTLHDELLGPVHLGIKDGKTTLISLDDIPHGIIGIDAKGAMVSPALIKSHFHIENTLLWETDILNQSSTFRNELKNEIFLAYPGIRLARFPKDSECDRIIGLERLPDKRVKE